MLASRVSQAGLLSLAISFLMARSIGLMAKKYCKQDKSKQFMELSKEREQLNLGEFFLKKVKINIIEAYLDC